MGCGAEDDAGAVVIGFEVDATGAGVVVGAEVCEVDDPCVFGMTTLSCEALEVAGNSTDDRLVCIGADSSVETSVSPIGSPLPTKAVCESVGASSLISLCVGEVI